MPVKVVTQHLAAAAASSFAEQPAVAAAASPEAALLVRDGGKAVLEAAAAQEAWEMRQSNERSVRDFAQWKARHTYSYAVSRWEAAFQGRSQPWTDLQPALLQAHDRRVCRLNAHTSTRPAAGNVDLLFSQVLHGMRKWLSQSVRKCEQT